MEKQTPAVFAARTPAQPGQEYKPTRTRRSRAFWNRSLKPPEGWLASSVDENGRALVPVVS